MKKLMLAIVCTSVVAGQDLFASSRELPRQRNADDSDCASFAKVLSTPWEDSSDSDSDDAAWDAFAKKPFPKNPNPNGLASLKLEPATPVRPEDIIKPDIDAVRKENRALRKRVAALEATVGKQTLVIQQTVGFLAAVFAKQPTITAEDLEKMLNELRAASLQ